jgi:hypothetical protein
MPLRTVTDAVGTTWHVWCVTPDVSIRRSRLGIAPAYEAGWLAFEPIDPRAGTTPEKRRLAPVPADWESAPTASLLALLDTALPVRRRMRE